MSYNTVGQSQTCVKAASGPGWARPTGRAIALYLTTIVLPACLLVWLGLQSFERQREALETLRADRLNAEVEARTHEAAEAALGGTAHPMARHFFTMEHGEVIRPALHAPPPRPAPQAFEDAEREELTLGRPDLALASYRRLLAAHRSDSLALARIAPRPAGGPSRGRDPATDAGRDVVVGAPAGVGHLCASKDYNDARAPMAGNHALGCAPHKSHLTREGLQLLPSQKLHGATAPPGLYSGLRLPATMTFRLWLQPPRRAISVFLAMASCSA